MLVTERERNWVWLLVALGMSMSAWVSANEPSKVVVDYTQSAGSGKGTTIYCNVETPVNYQISSHADAELLSTLAVGTLVKKGDVVATQDPTYLQNEIDLLEVAKRQAKINSSFYKQEYDRLKALGKEDLVSKSRLNELKTTHSTTNLEVESLTAQLDIARYKFAKLQLQAPVTGEITRLDANLGERLTVGSAVMQILPTELKQLKCKMSYALFQEYHQLATARFFLAEQQTEQELQLKRQGQHLDQTLQVMDLFLALSPAQASELMVGQRLKVRVSEAKSQVTTVPYDALIIEKDSYHMWFVDSDNKVSKLKVKVLRTNKDHYTIESTLKPGDKVVVKGKQGLESGKVVSPVLVEGARLQGNDL